jgi:hypothetical protein
LDQLPVEIQNYLEFISKWTEKYRLHTKFSKHNYVFTLKESNSFPLKNGAEIIQIHISHKPIFYSIKFQELIVINNRKRKYKTICAVIVRGNNTISDIIQDTEKILQKRVRLPHSSHYPF